MYNCFVLKDFERSRAFSFLSEVKKRFQTTYGSRAQTALPYAMNSEFSSTLAAQMVSMTIDCNRSILHIKFLQGLRDGFLVL